MSIQSSYLCVHWKSREFDCVYDRYQCCVIFACLLSCFFGVFNSGLGHKEVYSKNGRLFETVKKMIHNCKGFMFLI